MTFTRTISAIFATLVAVTASAGTVEKAPDLGPYWQPLYPNGGSYIYANSFVANGTGPVSELGFWARGNNGFEDVAQVVLEIYDSGAAPDSTMVAVQSGVIDLALTDTLAYISATPIINSVLTHGATYWFAANVVGLMAVADMQVGGHTQNSGGIVDDGTFWYSNDPSGINFDGQNGTPEMALKVVTRDTPPTIPLPAGLPLVLTGLGALALLRRRKA